MVDLSSYHPNNTLIQTGKISSPDRQSHQPMTLAIAVLSARENRPTNSFLALSFTTFSKPFKSFRHLEAEFTALFETLTNS
jgi:hypothetical protein